MPLLHDIPQPSLSSLDMQRLASIIDAHQHMVLQPHYAAAVAACILDIQDRHVIAFSYQCLLLCTRV